jgi:NAD(P)-dependent dehydrogenase (short-subunit alcohol dehydrogenase family)
MATDAIKQPLQNYQPAADALAGRVVAITGAGSGIGRALAMAAAAHGAEVVLIGSNVKRLESVHAAILAARSTALASIAPLNLEHALAKDYDQLTAAIGERYGRLDGLVHCAALLGTPAPAEHYDVPTWCRVMHVNLTAAFVLTQGLLPWLRAANDGSLIFTSCSEGRRPGAYSGAYAISKAAIEALSLMLADEYSNLAGIRVNTLDPGPARTALRRAAFPSDLSRVPEAAALVLPYLWLLGPASRGVSGQALQGPGVASSPG